MDSSEAGMVGMPSPPSHEFQCMDPQSGLYRLVLNETPTSPEGCYQDHYHLLDSLSDTKFFAFLVRM